MEALHQKYKDKGLVMLAVNVDENGAAAVKKFLQKTPYSFPILIDTKNVAQKSYGVFRFPESFIIDRNGVVVEKIIGGRDWMSDGAFKLIEFLLNG
jgi:peroxiredoxin